MLGPREAMEVLEALDLVKPSGFVYHAQVSLVVKNPPANAGDIRDTVLIPGLGRSPGDGSGIT